MSANYSDFIKCEKTTMKKNEEKTRKLVYFISRTAYVIHFKFGCSPL